MTTPTAEQGVALLFGTYKQLVPPAERAAFDGRQPSLNLSLSVRHEPGATKRLQFGLQARGDETVPCCDPGPAVVSSGTGAWERLSKTIQVPAGCDIQLCSVTFQLLSQGVVYLDEVELVWAA